MTDSNENSPINGEATKADVTPASHPTPAAPAAPASPSAPTMPAAAAPIKPAAVAARPSRPTPTPQAVPTAGKPESSISFDDEPKAPSVSSLIFDAVAAVAAIAFTVLIVQDALPFLKQ